MNFWTLAQSLGAQLIWKLGEPSGAVASDSSGHGRDGTVVGTPAWGSPSLIPNVGDTCINFDGVNDEIQLNNASWMDVVGTFSFVCFIKPTNFTAQREIGGKVQSWQIWLLTSGKLRFYVSPTWSNVDALTALIAGHTYMVGVRKDAGKIAIFINGVKDNEIAHAPNIVNTTSGFRFGSSSTSPVRFLGPAQGAIYYPNVALSDADFANLYTQSQAAPNLLPSTPGAFVHPTVGEEFDNLAALSWGASIDPESQPVQYYGEYSLNGGTTWAMLFDWQSGASYNWNTSALIYNKQLMIRVKARDEDPANETSWRTSGLFTIRHASVAPSKPVLTMPNVTDYSIELKITNTFSDGDPGNTHLATIWQIDLESGDFSLPKYNAERSDMLLAGWLTGLPQNTSLKVRCAFVDNGGQLSSWSDTIHFKTRYLLQSAKYPWRARDISGSGNHGTYGSVAGLIENFSNSSPPALPIKTGGRNGELGLPNDLADRGCRLRMYNNLANYTQGLTDYLHVIRINGLRHLVANGAVPDAQFTVIMVIRPESLAQPQELFGVPQQLFAYYTATGDVKFIANGLLDPGNQSFVGQGGLQAGVANLVCFSYSGSLSVFVAASSPIRLAPESYPAKFSMGVNDTRTEVLTSEKIVAGDSLGYNDMSWGPLNDWFDVGHGSSNPQIGSADAWANGSGFKGIISEFAFIAGLYMTASQYNTLWPIVRSSSTTDFEATVKALFTGRKGAYYRFPEPEPPRKPTIKVSR